MRFTLTLMGFLFTLSACHLSGKGDGSGTQSGTPTELTGTWTKPCSADATGDFAIHIFEFGNADVTYTHQFYSDSVCTLARYTRVETGTYYIGTASSQSAGATNLDFNFTGLTVTLFTAPLVTQYNGFGTCGGGWVLNTAKDCSATEGDLFQIFSNAARTLTIGTIDTIYDGTTSSKRPRTLDVSGIFTLS